MTPAVPHEAAHSALATGGGVASAVVLATYLLLQLVVMLYSSHRYLVLWWSWKARRGRLDPRAGLAEWPQVTVQLPLYNEPQVARRLIDAVASLHYPRDRLEIQILDDSTDGTTELAAAAAAELRARGVDVTVYHRPARRGYKAGALAEGLARARGEFVAVFDADFVPPRDFLTRLLPHFADPGVGMVQARWGHLNRGRSLLTEAQAVMLDAHFLLEHEVRMARGCFFNFNGTAGIWRRACIEAAGGWSCDTLTEDLDLSYRGQLGGWRFVFDRRAECPAELPIDIEALKSQQRRWTRGSIQTAVKMLPRVWASGASRAAKLEALVHLTNNLTYPLLVGLAVLMLPVMIAVPDSRSWTGAALQLGVLLFGVLPVGLFLMAGQLAAGSRDPWRIVRGAVAALVLGIGLSVNNALAALRGFRTASGNWERTPKTGDEMAHPAPRPSAHRPRSGVVEALFALYFGGLGVFAANTGHTRALPFVLLLMAGFGFVAWCSRPAATGVAGR